MKILLIVPDFYPSSTGYSNAFQGLHNSIQSNPLIKDIVILNLNSVKVSDSKFNESIVYSIPLPGIRKAFNFNVLFGWLVAKIIFIRKLHRINKIIKQHEIDLVFSETLEHVWLSLYLHKKHKLKIINRLHGAFPEAATLFSKELRYGNKFLKYLFEMNFIATTTYHYIDFLKNYQKDHLKLRDKDFFIIPNTMHDENFREEEIQFDHELRIFQLGRMDSRGYYYKGFDDTIKALFYLEESLPEQILKKIKISIVGDGKNFDKFSNLLKKLQFIEYSLTKRVSNDEVQNLIKRNNLILMPSRNEGMSMFALEGVFHGKAFIFTKGNGLEGLVIDKYNGVEIRPFNYLDLAKGIEYYLKNPESIITFGKNSRKHYLKNFSNSAIEKYFNVLIRSVN